MSLTYIKPLDGIRFLAVTLVLLDHWSGDKMGFPAGYLGVCLFFVLEGLGTQEEKQRQKKNI